MLRKISLRLGVVCVLLLPYSTASHAAATDIVLTAADAMDIHGRWTTVPDSTASTGMLLASADQGWSNPNAPLPFPGDHIDFTFTPQPNTRYRVWLRLRAPGGSKFNDSVFVQFSHALDASGKPRYRIGTDDALLVNLQSCNGCALQGWGWVDGAYWLSQTRTLTFAAGGSQVLRVQTREDGVELDQIVLSPERYLTAAPGPNSNDTTLLPVTRRAASTPMTEAAAVPGTILAENFDNGGAGVAYHDTTAGNLGGVYRDGDVDLQARPDGGYAVAWIAPGEWLNYAVRVAAAGEYRLEAQVASAGAGGTFHVNFDGENVTGALTIPDTGDFNTYTSISTVVRLKAGAQTMKVVFDRRDVRMGNLASLRFTSLAPPPPPPPAYTTFTVAAGGNVQSALNEAKPGDVILLEAGATFVGNFVLPAKSGDGYVTIRSSAPDAVLPAAGVRIDPSYAPHLPKLRSPNSAPALVTAPGAHHYRLQFLEFQANYNGFGNIINLGDGSSKQNTLDAVPYALIVDRVYIHGDPALGQKRGIALNSGSTTIVNSYISDIKAVGQDSQAIAGWNGPGPYLIDNNYLEGAGENVLFGGADPAIPNLVPSDITFTRNHLAKPWSWRGGKWVVKNLFELKSAQRVLVDGNLMENNWLAGQAGYAILLKSVNQDGKAPWSVVQDVVFSNNVVRHVASAINILGRDPMYPAIEANNITFRNNLFYDVSGAKYGGAGRFLQIVGGAAITFDHNTVINDGSITVAPDVRETLGLVFTNNVILDNAYGIKGAGTASGNPTITKFFPSARVVGNVMARSKSSQYPVANFYPVTVADVGFADFAGADYRLAPTSLYRYSATDGTDPGVDYAALAHAQRK